MTYGVSASLKASKPAGPNQPSSAEPITDTSSETLPVFRVTSRRSADGGSMMPALGRPAAVGSTLVSNPITFGPLYYVAWRLGNALIGQPAEQAPAVPPVVEERPNESWWSMAKRRAIGVGKPLLLGLAIMATGVGLFTYFAVSWLWATRVRWIRRRRVALRRARR